MSKIIALAGKGGVGKSTIATRIIRTLSKNDVVLAIDADPNSNLPEKLGMVYNGTIGGMRNELVKDPDSIPAGVSKHEHMAMCVRSLVEESDMIDLLVMGRPEGEGCYCFTNNVLKECFSDLVPKYKFTVIDNEAGMEHISRKVIPDPDVLILVSDPTIIGIRTAARLKELADEVGIKIGRTILVINNISVNQETLLKEASVQGFTETVTIPHDVVITEMASETVESNVPDDSVFAMAVDGLTSIL